MEESIQETLANLDATLISLKVSNSTQGLKNIISPYSGEASQCREWLTSVEKYAELNCEDTHNGKIRLAYMTARGAVSDFIKRFIADTPADEITWPKLTKNMMSHFGLIVDSEHAHAMLRKIKQKPGETISLFSERIYELSKDAYADCDVEQKLGAKEMAEKQMVNYFVDGLIDISVKLKVLREGCSNLADALAVARNEAAFMRRFELRNLNVHRYRPTTEHSGAASFGHTVECWKCGTLRHYARDCHFDN